MIYRHKRTGVLYRLLIESFSVERQAPSMIYVSLSTGDVFDRDAKIFAANFEFVRKSQEIAPKSMLTIPHIGEVS